MTDADFEILLRKMGGTIAHMRTEVVVQTLQPIAPETPSKPKKSKKVKKKVQVRIKPHVSERRYLACRKNLQKAARKRAQQMRQIQKKKEEERLSNSARLLKEAPKTAALLERLGMFEPLRSIGGDKVSRK